METPIDTSNLSVIYVQEVGIDKDNKHVYEFLITENPDTCWKDNWNEVPACNEQDLKPSEDQYEYVKELRTDIKLALGQHNCCVSFMDIKDNIFALCFEDLSEVEEYPEPRIVVLYGDPLDEVERMFAQRNCFMKYI